MKIKQITAVLILTSITLMSCQVCDEVMKQQMGPSGTVKSQHLSISDKFKALKQSKSSSYRASVEKNPG